jgi:hypothetical protein
MQLIQARKRLQEPRLVKRPQHHREALRFIRLHNLRTHQSAPLIQSPALNVPSRCIRYSGHKLRLLSPCYGTAQGIRAVDVARVLTRYRSDRLVVVRPGWEVVRVPEYYGIGSDTGQRKRNSEVSP